MTRIFGMVTTKHSHRYTPYAIESFLQHTPLRAGDELILIDNNANFDDSSLPASSAVQILRHPEPKSFAHNTNIVLRRAAELGGDGLMLNNDIIFAKGWLAPLLNPRPAVYAPACNMQMNYRRGNLQLRMAMDLEDYLGHESDFEAIVDHHHQQKHGYKLVHSFPYYCVRIPNSVIKAVGLFDESFGITAWEDIDYSLRCYEKNIPLFFAVDSMILHFYGKSTWRSTWTPEERAAAELDNQRARERFSAKWSPELIDLFAHQKPDWMEKLRVAEEKATIQCYREIVEARAKNI